MQWYQTLCIKARENKNKFNYIVIFVLRHDLRDETGYIQKLKAEIYKPSPVLRVYIPKGRHEKRPLVIPIVKDRVVQQAIRQVIEPIFENT